MVSAAPFRDRVVHHAFCPVCEPIFERGFIFNGYANRKGKGAHRAVARYEKFRDRFRHVLRYDIYRYFPAIDHAILKRDLRRRLACEHTLDLADRIIDGSNPEEPVEIAWPGALSDCRVLDNGPLKGIHDDAWDSRQSIPYFPLS